MPSIEAGAVSKDKRPVQEEGPSAEGKKKKMSACSLVFLGGTDPASVFDYVLFGQ